MPSKRKVDGSWRNVTRRYRKVDGRWRAVRSKYVKVEGVWRKVQSYFYAVEKTEGLSNFVGTYEAGVLATGDYGASISGHMGNTGQTVYIGIQFPNIPDGASISFTLDYESSNPSSVILYARDAYGNSHTSWNRDSLDHSVVWSYWAGGILDMVLYVSATSTATAKFTIKNFRINGVLV